MVSSVPLPLVRSCPFLRQGLFRSSAPLEIRITYDLAFDRIVHNAVRIQMGDVNMRQRTMEKRG